MSRRVKKRERERERVRERERERTRETYRRYRSWRSSERHGSFLGSSQLETECRREERATMTASVR